MENFTGKKENFQIKNSDIFHIPAQNMTIMEICINTAIFWSSNTAV